MEIFSNLVNDGLRWGRDAAYVLVTKSANTNPEFRAMVRFLADERKTLGVTADRIKAYGRSVKYPKFPELDAPEKISQLIELLQERDVTGDRALEMCYKFRESLQDREYRAAFDKFVSGKTDIRISKRKLQKILGMSDFPCSLGYNLDLKTGVFKTSLAKGDRWYLSRKYDGMRCTYVPNHMYKTRKGHPMLSMANFPPLSNEYVLDGEICLVDQDGREDFQGSVSVFRKKTPIHEKLLPRVRFLVFDVLTPVEFYGDGEIGKTFGERLARFSKMELPKWCVLVCQSPYSSANLNTMKQRVRTEQWEGLIVRKDAKYAGKRSSDVLKIKNFDDDEYTVLEVRKGTKLVGTDATMRRVDTLAAVRIEHKGHAVWVGSGFNDKQRILYAAQPELILGQTITVQYFGETDDGSLRFPICKDIGRP